MRAAVSAGETLPAPVYEEWVARTGKPMLDAVGATEMPHIVLTKRFDNHRPTCTGRPVAIYEARSDDMIVSSGYNIAGPEAEAALLAHDDVLECAVIGAADAARDQIVEAHVVLAEGVAPDDATNLRLRDHVKRTIAPCNYTRRTVFTGALPKTQTGKIQRFRLRDPGG